MHRSPSRRSSPSLSCSSPPLDFIVLQRHPSYIIHGGWPNTSVHLNLLSSNQLKSIQFMSWIYFSCAYVFIKMIPYWFWYTSHMSVFFSGGLKRSSHFVYCNGPISRQVAHCLMFFFKSFSLWKCGTRSRLIVAQWFRNKTPSLASAQPTLTRLA